MAHVTVAPDSMHQLSEDELLEHASREMIGDYYADAPTIADKFVDKAGGAIMAAKVGKFFFKSRNKTQFIFAPSSTPVASTN